jgi:hypothetical protein
VHFWNAFIGLVVLLALLWFFLHNPWAVHDALRNLSHQYPPGCAGVQGGVEQAVGSICLS